MTIIDIGKSACAEAAETEVKRLRAAIIDHRSQKADDRCIEDDDKLYEEAKATEPQSAGD